MADPLFITGAKRVTEASRAGARLGSRFGRMDLACQLALLAVEGLSFGDIPRDRIGLCLSATAGSLSTDAAYWEGREALGGPSPTLFAYTLPSAAIGELAIRHRLTGPNLCLFGGHDLILPEAGEMLRGGEADACVCVSCTILTPAAAKLIGAAPAASACALFLQARQPGQPAPGGNLPAPRLLREIDRDIELVCQLICNGET